MSNLQCAWVRSQAAKEFPVYWLREMLERSRPQGGQPCASPHLDVARRTVVAMEADVLQAVSKLLRLHREERRVQAHGVLQMRVRVLLAVLSRVETAL